MLPTSPLQKKLNPLHLFQRGIVQGRRPQKISEHRLPPKPTEIPKRELNNTLKPCLPPQTQQRQNPPLPKAAGDGAFPPAPLSASVAGAADPPSLQHEAFIPKSSPLG